METAITYPCDVSYERRKKVVLSGFITILVLCVIWIAMPFARAEDSDLKTGYNNFKEFVVGELDDGMLSSLDSMFGDGSTSSTATVNKFFSEVKSDVENTSFIKAVAQAVKGMAMFLVVMFSFIALFKELQRGDGGLDMWAKCFVVVAIGLLAVLNWEAIVNALEAIGQFISQRVMQAITRNGTGGGVGAWIDTYLGFGDEDLQEGASLFNPGKLMGNVLLYVSTALKYVGLTAVWILFEVPLMMARVVLLTLLIEIVIRKMFFPLALAAIAGEGMRSPGVNYMKKFVALYIRIAMCYAIAAIGTVIAGGIASAQVDGVAQGILQFACLFVAYLTCTKLYNTTSQIANQVIGV